VIHEVSRRVITRFIEDAIRESRARIEASGVASPDDVRAAGRALAALSPEMARADNDVKTFLFARMYRHPEVSRVREKADAIVRALFAAYVETPDAMPREWAARAEEGERERAAADYIAGMTDRFALGEYRRLFDPGADLR
jgi:dGTPase